MGTQFATTYSYGDEYFFENLDEMFTQAVKTLKQSEQVVIDKFLPRLNNIVHEAEGIGWGYGDALNMRLNRRFQRKFKCKALV